MCAQNLPRVVKYSLEETLQEIESNKAIQIVIYDRYKILITNVVNSLVVRPAGSNIPDSIFPTMDDGYMLSAHEVECLDVFVKELFQTLRDVHYQLGLYNEHGVIRYTSWQLNGSELTFWIHDQD